MRSGVLSWVSSILTLIPVSRILSWWTHKKEAGMVFKMSPLLQIKESKRIRLKSQFSEIFSLQLKKWCWRIKSSDQKGCQNNKYQQRSSLSLSLTIKQIYHLYKRKLWMERPVPSSQSKRKTQKTFSVIKKASLNNYYSMGMRNKWIHLYYFVTI